MGDVDVAFEIRRYEGTEIINTVLNKKLHQEDAGVVDNSINRAKLLNSGVDYLLCGSCLTDVSVHQRKLVGSLQLSRLCRAARGTYNVIATFQEGFYYCSADSLRGARYDYRLLSVCHVSLLLLVCG